MTAGNNREKAPTGLWLKTRKGRGYLNTITNLMGYPTPGQRAILADEQPFAEKYNVHFRNFGNPAPQDAHILRRSSEKICAW